MLIFLFQIFQSMGFNGLIDVPQLFMILLSLAFFVFRKSFYSAFVKINFFVAYYIHFMIVLKVIYGIVYRIRYVQAFFTEHKDYVEVKTVRVLFGDRLPEKGESMEDLKFKMLCYQCLLIVTACCC